MNVSLNWLRAILPALDDSPARIAERLAMLGSPVDAVTDLGEPLRDIIIARVLQAGRHPNADRLSLCSVDAGTGEALSVVCGAPNVRAGAYYPFIPAGGTLPGGITIRRSKIRGEVSNGMLCSPREIGLGRDHDGVLELHGEFTPGASFTESVGLNDVRFEVDVTPNRADLLSHWGIARELSPDGEASMRLPVVASDPLRGLEFDIGGPSATWGDVRINLEDPLGCPRYMAAILRGVRIGPSPEWLASRLRAVGARPINNVVDATNWVLFELGQPLHGFDLGKAGSSIVVRRARNGEMLRTLDGEDRRLNPGVLVIADERRPIALAGIMGGEATEVTRDTTDILLECALFDPKTIRAGRRSLDMSTDASYRFERGVDPDGMQRAVRRAVELIVATAGGAADGAVPVADAGVPGPLRVRIRTVRAGQVLGVPVGSAEIRSLLEPLGFGVTEQTESSVEVTVPGHRRYDVGREIDLVEEIARRRGYDTFPEEIRPFRASAVPDDVMAQLEDDLRIRLVARGLLEARGLPLVPESDGDVALMLPLASTESRLRRDLLPGLIHRVEFNFNRGARDVRLFELGTAFGPVGSDGLPRETTNLAIIMTGSRAPHHWTGEPEALDLWDLKGLVEEIGARLGATIAADEPGASPAFLVGERFRFVRDGRAIGTGGRIEPGAIDAPVWAGPVFAAEFTLDRQMATAPEVRVQPLPMHPAVDRDLALVAPDQVTSQQLSETIRGAGGALLESVAPFDVYAGSRFGAGRRSIAFRMRFRAADRTLTVEEVDAVVDRILERLREDHDAERRG